MAIEQILSKLADVEGVQGVFVVSKDGLILDSVGSLSVDLTSIAAIASSGLGSAEVLGETAALGGLDQEILEFKNGKAVIQSINQRLLLCMIASKQANLGMIRYTIDKEIESIRTTL
ncbi:MAG TPA: roadblock/LC7 domain-containing protein [Caldisericia bacterium]|nr:roadblock/LC7 domain-containing protein [Caldisericia bacterium]HPF48725.1 roadblock/LC7 domain-containing protein [Caldisericia bacterium]HPI83615.1 roadblock/LC7 domain-containing protein [Caldisericia bacterium]HPQ93180.1 roadblock/LC7 domain-containing protein [Caldisericia bacterium]HRV74987.1 roadblock/LC7 domain-containing protein [Caldisericia bacterium]